MGGKAKIVLRRHFDTPPKGFFSALEASGGWVKTREKGETITVPAMNCRAMHNTAIHRRVCEADAYV